MKTWRDVDRNEFHKFLELSLLMGNIQFPSFKLYWREKSIYHHPFGKTMSPNWFENILRAFCSYDVKNAESIKTVDMQKLYRNS